MYSFCQGKIGNGLFPGLPRFQLCLFIPSWKWPYEAANYMALFLLFGANGCGFWSAGELSRKEIKGAWIVFLGWSGNFLFFGSLYCPVFFSTYFREFPYGLSHSPWILARIFLPPFPFLFLLAIEYALNQTIPADQSPGHWR